MADLWTDKRAAAVRKVEPLAARMRPRTLDEVAGQGHIVGEGKLLRRMLRADALTSVVFFGPPGTGKTTLAEVVAAESNRHFERENASGVGVARIREIIKEAEERLANSGRRTVLFLDEIHRFSKSQQDVLLGDVERGLITLIGATTENPYFAINSALVSRSTLFRFEPLTPDDIKTVVRRAIADPERGYGKLRLDVTEDALGVWAIKSDGDARRALTALEVAVLSSLPVSSSPNPQSPIPAPSPISIDRAAAQESIQQKAAVYSGTGDEHYDSISAMIKSVRGSDPDAAVYWIARMLEAGEDPRFIARRLAILASEDIGNADPRGIMVAAAAWELVERIGMPEARITLAQCATYLAMAPKSNASYTAIEAAAADVREGRTVAVPLILRDKHAPPSEGGKHGEGYVYTHDLDQATDNPVSGQDYLGVAKRYYEPLQRGHEKVLAQKLEEIRRAREAVRGSAKGREDSPA